MTTETKTYNGWRNYETWCVNLWLTNEEYTEDELRMLAQASASEYHRADCLKRWVMDVFYESNVGEGYGMLYDLLNSALDNVDLSLIHI